MKVPPPTSLTGVGGVVGRGVAAVCQGQGGMAGGEQVCFCARLGAAVQVTYRKQEVKNRKRKKPKIVRSEPSLRAKIKYYKLG